MIITKIMDKVLIVATLLLINIFSSITESTSVGIPAAATITTTSSDHIRDFSCGKLYYRTFHLDPSSDSLYVGAMDKIYRLHLNNINRTRCDLDSVILDPDNVNNCISKGKSGNYDCRNHVRVLQVIDGNKLYVCGTNAHAPKDLVLRTDLSAIHPNDYPPGITGNGIAKCPFDPDDNSTAIWVNEGNPGNLPGLYSGTVAEFTKADSVIFRMDLFNNSNGGMMGGQSPTYPFKRTIKYDSKWLDKPHFVGSFDIQDYVFFFFRENAVEYINCGKNIYSRVARICKGDMGGKNILAKSWATYLKARLNCSIPGEFPFYFNEIQHVYKHPEDNQRFYAVFSTSSNGLSGSAICTFSLESIQEVFNGKFKEQVTSSSAWLPVLTSKVPDPRPGSCVNNSQSLPDSVLNFIRSHPLMDSAVSSDGGKPIFYRRDVIFTKIVVDTMIIDGMRTTIYFAGTSNGLVYKVVEWMIPGSTEVHSQLIDTFDATYPEPVRAIELSPHHKSLYVSSDSHVRQIDLFTCKTRHESCIKCSRDPYCGWDRGHNECKPFTRGLIQNIDGSDPGVCDDTVKMKELKVNFGSSVHLPCPSAKNLDIVNAHAQQKQSTGGPNNIDYNSLPISKSSSVKWYYYKNDRSPGIQVLSTTYNNYISSDRGSTMQDNVNNNNNKFVYNKKIVQTIDGGLVILGMSERESGRYECRYSVQDHPYSIPLIRYNVSVDPKTCSSSSESEFKKIYSDWCNEFEKYKSAMKNWQSKCSAAMAATGGGGGGKNVANNNDIKVTNS